MSSDDQEKRDGLSRRQWGVIGLVVDLAAMAVATIGSWALIQAWVWKFPLVLLLFLGAVAFFIAWVLVIFFLYACIQEIRGVEPDESSDKEG